MYNKVKRIFSLITGILCIVMGGLSCLCGLESFIMGVEHIASLIMFSMLSIGLGVPLIILGSKLVKAPVKYNGVWEDRKKLHIGIIVIVAIFSVYSLMALSAYAVELEYGVAEEEFTLMVLLHYLNFLISAPALPLNIVSMCLKAEKEETSAQAPYASYQQPVYQQPTVFSEFERTEAPAPTPAAQEVAGSEDISLDAKVKKLKEWKEKGIISEEQYEESIRKILDNIVD